MTVDRPISGRYKTPLMSAFGLRLPNSLAEFLSAFMEI